MTFEFRETRSKSFTAKLAFYHFDLQLGNNRAARYTCNTAFVYISIATTLSVLYICFYIPTLTKTKISSKLWQSLQTNQYY